MPLQPHVHCLICLTLLLSAAIVQAEQAAPAAGTPPAATERAPLSERSDLEASALERQLAVGEQQQLQAGESNFLALWLAANSPEPKGVVILLPGDDESADAPPTIGPLRRKLPDAGWHSLSLTLPDPQGEPLPERSSAPAAPAAQNPAPAAPAAAPAAEPTAVAPDDESAGKLQEARTAHVERVFARIDAGVAFAGQQQAKRIILLGNGTGAYWAMRYLAEKAPANVSHLLLVDIRQPSGFVPPPDELLPQLKARVADFYHRDSAISQQSALQRKQISQRQKQPTFTQVGLDAMPGNPDLAAEQLFRRLRGWMDKQFEDKK